ncbi:MAG: helix-hairpin-helix domain-containing protein [Flavobacteriia bacterium]|nr:helix-hairpin-helix domain-containing protein [Flavobacteriia bacterium]
MKNNKTLYVTEQFKRKGFLFFLLLMFLGHLVFYFYVLNTPNQDLIVFEPIPDQLFDSVAPLKPRLKTSLVPVKAAIKSIAVKAKKDINKVGANDLQAIRGIGPVLSKRIVKYRNSLGGFVHLDLLYEVYGLDSTVVQRIKEQYSLISMPAIETISVNAASAYELSRLPFISKEMSLEIVSYRAKNGLFINFEEILNIIEIPPDKIHIIQLYLTYN